jgi:hypothetical protein
VSKMLVTCVLVVLCLVVVQAAFAEGAAVVPDVQPQLLASLSTPLPTLTSSQFEALQATKSDSPEKGGCMSAFAGCIADVPMGQFDNSGVKANWGRSILRFLVVGRVYDSYKAYTGETAEEYVGVASLEKGTETPSEGGIAPGFKSCLFAGVPGGQLMNSGYEVPTRSWLRVIPYLGWAVQIYDGAKAYSGETLNEYVQF